MLHGERADNRRITLHACYAPLMHRRMVEPIFASVTYILLSGCGDDGVGSADETTATTMAGTTSTTGEVPTTGGEMSTTMVETSSTDTTPTTGEESTTGAPTGCQVPADDSDEDADGVMNKADNCRCDANPNQLDFDDDAIGNVCDLPLKFSIAEGSPPEFNELTTLAHAEKALDCDFAVSLVVLDSVIEVAPDDVGTAMIYASRINYADTPELECDLGQGAIVKLRVQQFFADGVDPLTVGFPFAIADHDAGTLPGVTNAPHDILASATINVTESPNKLFLPEGEQPLMAVPGRFPLAAVGVVNKGQQISLVFADEDMVLFEQTTRSGVTFRLTGLTGTLRLKQ